VIIAPQNTVATCESSGAGTDFSFTITIPGSPNVLVYSWLYTQPSSELCGADLLSTSLDSAATVLGAQVLTPSGLYSSVPLLSNSLAACSALDPIRCYSNADDVDFVLSPSSLRLRYDFAVRWNSRSLVALDLTGWNTSLPSPSAFPIATSGTAFACVEALGASAVRITGTDGFVLNWQYSGAQCSSDNPSGITEELAQISTSSLRRTGTAVELSAREIRCTEAPSMSATPSAVPSASATSAPTPSSTPSRTPSSTPSRTALPTPSPSASASPSRITIAVEPFLQEITRTRAVCRATFGYNNSNLLSVVLAYDSDANVVEMPPWATLLSTPPSVFDVGIHLDAFTVSYTCNERGRPFVIWRVQTTLYSAAATAERCDRDCYSAPRGHVSECARQPVNVVTRCAKSDTE